MRVMFNSSLPRAGSTLLQNIFAQNPEFYVTPTSGVLELLYSSRAIYSESLEFKAQDKETVTEGFRKFCLYGMMGYFKGVTDKPYILDKSRGWGIHYDFIDFFYPRPKIVCMIRDPRSVFASMEKNYLKNPEIDKGMTNHSEMTGTTTEKRVGQWLGTQPIGLAFERLWQGVREEKPIRYIKYEEFAQSPESEMRKIYDLFELPYYDGHDYNNVEQATEEDDVIYGYAGDHNIKKVVKYSKPDYNEVLGENACEWIRNECDWFYQRFDYK